MFFVTNVVTGEVRAYSSQYNAEMAVGMDLDWVHGKLDIQPTPMPEPEPERTSEPTPEPKRRGRPRKVKAEEQPTAEPSVDGGIDAE